MDTTTTTTTTTAPRYNGNLGERLAFWAAHNVARGYLGGLWQGGRCYACHKGIVSGVTLRPAQVMNPSFNEATIHGTPAGCCRLCGRRNPTAGYLFRASATVKAGAWWHDTATAPAEDRLQLPLIEWSHSGADVRHDGTVRTLDGVKLAAELVGRDSAGRVSRDRRAQAAAHVAHREAAHQRQAAAELAGHDAAWLDRHFARVERITADGPTLPTADEIATLSALQSRDPRIAKLRAKLTAAEDRADKLQWRAATDATIPRHELATAAHDVAWATKRLTVAIRVFQSDTLAALRAGALEGVRCAA